MIEWFLMFFGIIVFAAGLYGLSNKDLKREHRWVAVSFLIFSFYVFSQVHTEEFNPDLHECLEIKYGYYFMTNEEAEQTYDDGSGRCDIVKTARYNGVLCRSEECISFHEKKQVVSDD